VTASLVVAWSLVALYVAATIYVYYRKVLPVLAEHDDDSRPRDSKIDEIPNFRAYVAILRSKGQKSWDYYLAVLVSRFDGFRLPLIGILTIITIVVFW
jgi:hypothetical protein